MHFCILCIFVLMLIDSHVVLRFGGVVQLKQEDINSKKMLIHISGSNGRKDRDTMLSDTALEILRRYFLFNDTG